MGLGMVGLSDLQGQLVLTGVAFVLTTLLGTIIANRYESRRAKTDFREKQRDAARVVYEELSRLMDKRLYRMRQVAWVLDRIDAGKDEVEAKWADYRGVLYEWNDSLNRNLALTLRYFGPAVMEKFECDVAEMFAGANEELREHHRERLGEADGSSRVLTLEQVDLYLEEVEHALYRLNDQMLAVIAMPAYAPSRKPRPPCADGPVGRRRNALLQEFKLRLAIGEDGNLEGEGDRATT
jgi:hypothetical protein